MMPPLSVTYRAGTGNRYSGSSWNLSTALPKDLTRSRCVSTPNSVMPGEHSLFGPVEGRYLIARDLIRDYFAAGGRSLWSIRDCSALRNESSVSIVLVNPAWRSLMVLTKARGPAGAP